MSSKKLMVIFGLFVLISACTPGSYDGVGMGSRDTQMGTRYLLGRGVQQNDTTAFGYFQKAANSGDVFAQNEVAFMYAAGKGTKRDLTAALAWYQKAAEQGLASAQYNLGLMYWRGLGTSVNK